MSNVLFHVETSAPGWRKTAATVVSGDAIAAQQDLQPNWYTNVVHKTITIADYSCTGKFDVIVATLVGDPARAQDYVVSARPGVNCNAGDVQITLAIGPSTDVKDLHSAGVAVFHIMITQFIA